MNLIDLVSRTGITPKRVANTHGGEYHSPCPVCGGDDRFIIHPNKKMKNCTGSYFCRQCGIRGDSIQFCLDYLGCENFPKALAFLGLTLPNKNEFILMPKVKNPTMVVIERPSIRWQEQAQIFVQEAHDKIWSHSSIIAYLAKRGLPAEAIKKYNIGYAGNDKKIAGYEWGLDQEEIFLSKGIVIPTYDQSGIIRLKIRRDGGSGDTLSKYMAVTGSMRGLNIIGYKKSPVIIIVESELDAYVLHYAVGDFAVVVAVGGCTKDPDPMVDYLVKNKIALVCHDNDDAGKNMFLKWQMLYAHAKACPTPYAKDIGEAIEQGLHLRCWIASNIILNRGWDYGTQNLIQFFMKHIMSLPIEDQQVYKGLVYRIVTTHPTSEDATTIINSLNGVLYLIQGVKNAKEKSMMYAGHTSDVSG
jgi:hypothetical protein